MDEVVNAALTASRSLIDFVVRSENEHARDCLRVGPVGGFAAMLLQNSQSLPERSEPVEFLNENAMGPVRFLHKGRARRESICNESLLVGVVLGLIAHQDPVLGGRRIDVIQFPSVSDGGNLAGWQRAYSLLLFGSSHSSRPKPGLHQEILLLGRRTDTGGCALACRDQSQR